MNDTNPFDADNGEQVDADQVLLDTALKVLDLSTIKMAELGSRMDKLRDELEKRLLQTRFTAAGISGGKCDVGSEGKMKQVQVELGMNRVTLYNKRKKHGFGHLLCFCAR